MFSDRQLREIFNRTKGHCHFCGDRIVFGKYGKPEIFKGSWETDHIIQKAKGGPKEQSNCLAACVKCNRLRWHRTGQGVRELLLYGLIAKDEIKNKTQIGKKMKKLQEKRFEANLKRRRQIGKKTDK